MIKNIIVTVFLLLEMNWACFNPADRFAEGVVFNSGEQVHLEVIYSMAIEGTHYVKEGDGAEEKITYISHSDPEAMVYLGHFLISSEPGLHVPRMAVVLDSTQNVDLFDFGQAIGTELAWLREQGVLSIPDQIMEEAVIGLTVSPKGNAQYWTLQKQVLPYNSWYEYNAETNEWSMETVRGTFGCGLDVLYSLPPQALVLPSAVKDLSLKPIRGLSIARNGSGFCIRLSAEAMEKSFLRVSNYRGEAVAQLPVNAGIQSIQWDGTDKQGNALPVGLYCISFQNPAGQNEGNTFRLK